MDYLYAKKLHELAKLPVKAYPTDAGFDLSSVVSAEVGFGKVTKIHTGISVIIPSGYYGRIAPRSGLAVKHGINVLAGVVDCNYTGEIVVLLTTVNNEDSGFVVNPGDKIAQLIIEKIIEPTYAFTWTDHSGMDVQPNTEVNTSSRGDNGFGSTGIQS